MKTLNGKNFVSRRAFVLDTWNWGHWEHRAIDELHRALDIRGNVSVREEADLLEYVRSLHEEYIALMDGHVFKDVIRGGPAELYGLDVEYARAGETTYAFDRTEYRVIAITPLRCRERCTESKVATVVVDGKEYTRTESVVTHGEWIEPDGLREEKRYSYSTTENITLE